MLADDERHVSPTWEKVIAATRHDEEKSQILHYPWVEAACDARTVTVMQRSDLRRLLTFWLSRFHRREQTLAAVVTTLSRSIKPLTAALSSQQDSHVYGKSSQLKHIAVIAEEEDDEARLTRVSRRRHSL